MIMSHESLQAALDAHEGLITEAQLRHYVHSHSPHKADPQHVQATENWLNANIVKALERVNATRI